MEQKNEVIYTWKTGDVAERCRSEVVFAKSGSVCFHCETVISQGSECVLLHTSRGNGRYLHRSCADAACHYAETLSRPHTHLCDY